DLLAEHDPEWPAELPAAALKQMSVEFRRGFVAAVIAAAPKFVTHARRLAPLVPLEAATLFQVGTRLDRLITCPQSERLGDLALLFNSENAPRQLASLLSSRHLTRLRSLRLPHSVSVQGIGTVLERWPGLVGLTRLVLHSKGLFDFG